MSSMFCRLGEVTLLHTEDAKARRAYQDPLTQGGLEVDGVEADKVEEDRQNGASEGPSEPVGV